MTNEEILQKALMKAVANGCGYPADQGEGKWLLDENREYEIIFSHDFARSFWGEEEVGWSDSELNLGGDGKPFREWQYQLRRMVLEEDPIKYLEQFLT